ncbi:hypothetical protein DIS18_04000 [Algibacter marinivivus]|uniref:DUF4270 domain-containing protein n=1 Tax=Algibacter marinivivus TaxID=2100723 RepID=A0A2U2X7G0_9FLAO|nr:DUF4270 domain-containing protein [Algibacter marinivivus]PWH83726.1 hypothetical protein DIS18_04000 [Algibacter marinivivus]
MKNIFKALKLSTVFLLLLSSFIACDKDFSVVESDVLGEGNANFSTNIDTINVVAYNKKLDALQINNLSSNLLGVFNDPEYGKTTASIVTQLTPSTFDEDFGVNPVIDSVVINIPYFSTVTGVDTNNNNASTYSLDSIYGNEDASIKLTIYKNNYFLRDFDPSGDANSAQNYFSKAEDNPNPTQNFVLNGTQTINFDDHVGDIIYENDNLKINSEPFEQWTISATDTVKTFLAPAMRIIFDSQVIEDAEEISFWQQTIIDKNGDAVLSNANNFRNYFRGLYFKAESIGSDGNMALMNVGSTNSNITIYYKNGEETARTQDIFVLNFSGNRLNTFINEFNTSLMDGDKMNGDENLYLKGLEGSMAVVDLFGNEDFDNNMIPDELDDFLMDYRKTDSEGAFIKDNSGSYVLKRLINEAHLIIYEDESKISNDDEYHKYDRIYAYDVKNNSTTIDYQIDPTESNEAVNSKIFSLGQRENISTNLGLYKIRITEYLNNIIQNDSTNYQLGLVLSNNVNFTANSEILNSDDEYVTAVPSASIISPRGTILRGSNTNSSNKLILKVFFTEPKEN